MSGENDFAHFDHRVEATPENHLDSAAMLGDRENLTDIAVMLGNLRNLISSSDRQNGAIDTEELAFQLRQAISVLPLPENDPLHVKLLGLHGTLFRCKYSRTRALNDLEQAIHLGQEAVSTTPDNHPDRATILNNLGNRFRSRYDRTGALDDLEQAMRLGQEAVSATPENQLVGFPHVIGTLWGAYDMAFEIAKKFYNTLFASSKQSLESGDVAQALHEAVICLKSKGESPISWAPFIHFGA